MMNVLLLLLTIPAIFILYTYGDETEIENTLTDYESINFGLMESNQRAKREEARDLRVQCLPNYPLEIRNDADYVKNDLFWPAIRNWSSHLKPTHPLTRKLQVKRKCEIDGVKLEIESDGTKQQYCTRGCAPVTQCAGYKIPETYLSDCRTYNRGRPVNLRNGGEGLQNMDFLLITDASLTYNCKTGSLAHAQICQIDPSNGRPTVSYVNLCPALINAYKDNFEYQFAIVMHELGHALGFSNKGFAFMSDENGQPRTPRDPETNLPILGMVPPYIYTPSPETLAEFNETYVSRVTEVDRPVQGLRTPRVLEEARKYLGCPNLYMVQLENQGSEGSAGSHFEKRIYHGDLMTASPGRRKIVSNILLAFFEDSGWYHVNYAGSSELTWGKNRGCDFATNSCYEYKPGNQQVRTDAHPWCFELSSRCLVKKYVFTLPEENQYLSMQSGIQPNELPYYGGKDSFMDYCPYMFDAE